MSEDTGELSAETSKDNDLAGQIKEIARRLLGAVDKVTARHGWPQHTSDERDQRATIWERVHGDSPSDQDRAGRVIKEALERGIRLLPI